MKEIQFHPLSELFPLMPPSDIKELADDIKERGLQNPITLYEGKLLDGRHRYEACMISGVHPKWVPYKGNDPLGFVIASNLKRRHLTTSQKAMVAASISNLPRGGDRKSEAANQTANLRFDHSKAADSLAVSTRSVETASKILDESPKLAAQVRDGKISVHAAAEKLAEKKAKREPVLDETGYPVPDELHDLWARRGEIREMLAQVSNVENRLLQFQKDKDELYSPINFSSAVSKLQFAHMEIKAAQLYATCTTCQGRFRNKCAFCKGRGIISKFAWDKLVPEELKAIRQKAGKAHAT